MKKRRTLLAFMLIGLMLLSSCAVLNQPENADGEETGNNLMGQIVFSLQNLLNRRLKNLNSQGKTVKERAEQIVAAVKTHDKNALKAMFSERAIAEADDLDGKIDAMFDFIQGDIVSWKSEPGASQSVIDYGEKSTLASNEITVTTDQDSYIIFVSDYIINTIEPNKEGVFMLEVAKTSYHGIWGAWPDRMYAGIDIRE